MVNKIVSTRRPFLIALLCWALPMAGVFDFTTAGHAAIGPTVGSSDIGYASTSLGQWQRIDFRSEGPSARQVQQIKVAIQTRGPAMQGLIRIPGAPASNFDTGRGFTVVDLINVGNDAAGYAEIASLEILFTQKMPGQFYQVFAIDSLSGNGLEKQ